MSGEQHSATDRSIRRLSLFALVTIFILVGVIGGLAAATSITGAVIVSGSLVVDSQVKPVQHLRGGVVQKIVVRNGDVVEAGQILVRLDATQARANLAIIAKRLKELSATNARLLAERNDQAAFDITGSTDNESRQLLEGEKRLFQDRLASRQGRKSQLRERTRQLEQETEGLAAQEKGKRLEIELVEKELASLQGLLGQGIISATRVYSLQRETARLTGELGSLIASIAQSKGRITETQLQIIQIDDDHASEVSDEFRQTQSDIGQFSERLIAAEDELKRIDIRSPQAGVIDQLQVHAAGAVIAAGDTILRIVPSADSLVAELKVAPADIDQVVVGQPVVLRLSSFNQRDTLELDASIASVSADLVTDQQSGMRYYLARADISSKEWERLGALVPLQGMPVEAFVRTGERTMLAYLTKPITDQIERAFKEN
jgi:HlyD family secretion protein